MINRIISLITNIFHQNVKNLDNNDNNDNNDNTNNNIFNTNASILQGRYIRDNIKIHNIVNKIFKAKMMMDIEYQIWNLEKYDFFSMNTAEISKINNYISKKIMHLKNNKIYFIYLSIYEHVNLLYIDLKNNKNEKYYYIYEPHMPKNNDDRYPIPQKIENILDDNNFTKKNFPNYIIKQEQLPLCYMYILHFFVTVYHLENTNIKKKYIIDNYNDDIIMEFTEWILDLCYQNKMIIPQDYYLLTNKICQYNLFCEKNSNQIFLRSCNPKVLTSFFINNTKNRINFTYIESLHSDDINFYYMKKFIKLAENNNTISLFNKHQIFILSLLLKYYYNIDCSTNILHSEHIDQEIFVEALMESDILSKYIGYNFLSVIIGNIKCMHNKKILIKRFVHNYSDKQKCNNLLIKFVENIDKSKNEKCLCAGMRRQRNE
jgi:hypothetical protein